MAGQPLETAKETEMIEDYEARALPPPWMVEAWHGLGGRWLQGSKVAPTARLYPTRAHCIGPEMSIYRPWLKGPVAWSDFEAKCLETVKPDDGFEWAGKWSIATTPFGDGFMVFEAAPPEKVKALTAGLNVWWRTQRPSRPPGPYWVRRSEAYPWRQSYYNGHTLNVYWPGGTSESHSPADWEFGPRIPEASVLAKPDIKFTAKVTGFEALRDIKAGERVHVASSPGLNIWAEDAVTVAPADNRGAYAVRVGKDLVAEVLPMSSGGWLWRTDYKAGCSGIEPTQPLAVAAALAKYTSETK